MHIAEEAGFPEEGAWGTGLGLWRVTASHGMEASWWEEGAEV